MASTWTDVGKKIVSLLGPASTLAAPFLGPVGPFLPLAIKGLSLILGIKDPDPQPDVVMKAIEMNPQAAAELARAQMAYEHEVTMQQMAYEAQSRSEQAGITAVEAKDIRFWNSGWRPALGWVCASSLAAYYIPKAIMGTIIWVIACYTAGWELVVYPSTLDTGEILGLVGTLLGTAGLKTFEKVKGVTK